VNGRIRVDPRIIKNSVKTPMHEYKQQQKRLSTDRIEALDSLRGLAALLIVLFHLPKFNPVLNISFIDNSYLMVELFFVLSGFVIFNSYSKRIHSKIDLLRFQFLRVGRLYPVHLVFLMAFVLIELAKYFSQQNFGIEIKSQAFSTNSVMALVQQTFLVHAIGSTHNAITFNYPAWSISVELYTYLIFGVITLLADNKKNRWFLLIALTSIVLLGSKITFGFDYLLRCLAGFFIGCLTATIVAKSTIKMPSYTSLIALGCIVIFLHLKTSGQYDLFIYPLTSFLIASLVTSREGRLNQFLEVKVFAWLGALSYSIYMSHAFVIWLFEQIIKRLWKTASPILTNGDLTTQLSAVETIFTCAAILATVCIVSSFVYRFIEKPMREKSRRFAFSKIN
jgi:peptidoglycan/LPS O-acetylase OafA/YrhL